MHRFNFNLLPEKPKEIIVKEQKRESTSLYIAFMPLLAVIVGLFFIFLNEVVVQSSVDTWQNAVNERNKKIQTYRTNVSQNVEFVQKTELLSEPVLKDVEPENFFDLTEELLQKLSFKAEIQEYGRSPDGSFDITLEVDNINRTGDVLIAFESLSQVQLPNIHAINRDLYSDKADISVNFFLIEPEKHNP